MNPCDCTDCPLISRECICLADADTVTAITQVRQAFLVDRNAQLFLRTYNPRLNGVPHQLILAGRYSDVVDEARRIQMGAPTVRHRREAS